MFADKKNQLILLIEDNDDHAELAEFYINEYTPTFEVVRLSDGEIAKNHIEKINAHNNQLPWLIFLDLKLPKYDGHELLTLLKSNPYLSKVPVVVFTTSNSNKDIQQAMENNANSYIVKPIGVEEYQEVIT